MAAIDRPTQVILQGHGPITLHPENDHIATGGQGSIYRVKNWVVKLYLEPLRMRQYNMPDKITQLAQIKHPYIVSPEGLATNKAGEVIGFFMPFVKGHFLTRLFTGAYRKQQKFTLAHTSTLVDRMRDAMDFAHQNHAIMADANELNWLAVFAGKDPEPRVIDVDSWAIGRWGATAVMPSIRDWHSQTFDKNTDWFAWGIVTFQLYTGIHPYKGSLDGFNPFDVEGRMKANASVFSKGIRLNQSVRDFADIPLNLLNWYETTFQNGMRTRPPSPFDAAATAPQAARIIRTVITQTKGTLVFEKIIGYANDHAIRVFHCGVALLSSGRLMDLATKRAIGLSTSLNCQVVKKDNGWVIASMEHGQATLEYIDSSSFQKETLTLGINGYEFVSYENRLFLTTERGLTEIKIQSFGSKVLASAGQTWGAMLNSTKWFNGVGVLDAMGAMFLIVPFGHDAVAQPRVKELDGLRVVDAKAGNRFVSLIVLDKNGAYQKFELTFSKDYASYQSWQTTTDSPELNVAILPKGVCATIVRDGELAIFVPTSGAVNPVQDGQIATDMLLFNWDDKVVYIQNGEVWSLRLR